MPTAPFTCADINKLNSIIFETSKYACGPSRKASHIMTVTPRTEFGLGVEPQHLTYAKTLLISLEDRLNVTHDMSAITSGLLQCYRIQEASWDWSCVDINGSMTPLTLQGIGILTHMGVHVKETTYDLFCRPHKDEGKGLVCLARSLDYAHPI